MRMWAVRGRSAEGFALPTVLIASVVMLMMLLAGLTTITSVTKALRDQTYTQKARQAAEAGIARARACLKESNGGAKWNDTYPLSPDSPCTGTTYTCTVGICYLWPDVNVRFEVKAPTINGSTMKITSKGFYEQRRSGTASDVFLRYTAESTYSLVVQQAVDNVVFGNNGAGAFFLTRAADGSIKGVGENSNGQLGTANTTSSATARVFIQPGGVTASKVFSDFSSQATATGVITSTGRVLMAGLNTSGQLGDGTTTNRSTAVYFNFPAGETAKKVVITPLSTFVLTNSNNIYAAGQCRNNRIGTNNANIGSATCTQPVPTRVALPAVQTGSTLANQNTRPVDVVARGDVGYALMEGGAVWGWGLNTSGQLGKADFATYNTPVKIGLFSETGPAAKRILTDGNTLYILDTTGGVTVAGANGRGQTAAEHIIANNVNNTMCIDNANNVTASDGAQAWIYGCNPSIYGGYHQEWIFRENGEIRNANPGGNLCLTLAGGAYANGTRIERRTCAATSNSQLWYVDVDGRIKSRFNAAKCIDTNGGAMTNGTGLVIWDCTTARPSQVWVFKNQPTLSKFYIPSSGKVTDISVDQEIVSYLVDSNNDGVADQVWSAGNNAGGQFGNGSSRPINPQSIQFVIPDAGVNPVGLAVASQGSTAPSVNANLFVLGSNGKVYGAGGNAWGQLGVGNTSAYSTIERMSVIDGFYLRAQKVMTGQGTTIVYTANNAVYTVGNNANGQLGDGTTTYKSTPAAYTLTNTF